VRRTFALITTIGVLGAALTGCAGTASSPAVASGKASELVEAPGEFGELPRIDFPTPLHAETTQCSVLIEGDGPHLVDGQSASVAFSMRNATTGEVLQEAGYENDPLMLTLSDEVLALPGLVEGLTCASEGSRVAIVIPPEDGFAPQNNPQLSEDDSLVIVADIVKSYLPRADGVPQLGRDGFPAVVLAPDGRPGITVPKGDPFDTLETSVLRAGDGEVVQEDDTVVVHYTGVLWDDNSVFDSTWSKGTPVGFELPDGTVPGFADAVIGQTVGSQVIAIVPPDQGYGEEGSGAVPPGATLVFVIDILGIIPPAG
jgi:FKBP-type peptidyl-prolyl cis-trans isomerase